MRCTWYKFICIYYIKVSGIASSGNKLIIKVLREQTREANKRIKIFFGGLSLILFGFGNIVTNFHV